MSSSAVISIRKPSITRHPLWRAMAGHGRFGLASDSPHWKTPVSIGDGHFEAKNLPWETGGKRAMFGNRRSSVRLNRELPSLLRCKPVERRRCDAEAPERRV